MNTCQLSLYEYVSARSMRLTLTPLKASACKVNTSVLKPIRNSSCMEGLHRWDVAKTATIEQVVSIITCVVVAMSIDGRTATTSNTATASKHDRRSWIGSSAALWRHTFVIAPAMIDWLRIHVVLLLTLMFVLGTFSSLVFRRRNFTKKQPRSHRQFPS